MRYDFLLIGNLLLKLLGNLQSPTSEQSQMNMMLEQVVAIFRVTAEWSSISVPTTWTDKIALSSDHGNLSFMHIPEKTSPQGNQPFRRSKDTDSHSASPSSVGSLYCSVSLVILFPLLGSPSSCVLSSAPSSHYFNSVLLAFNWPYTILPNP